MRPMQQVAEDVHHLPLGPRAAVNAYVLGDVVVDAGTRVSGGAVVKAVRGRTIKEHVLTHAHIDHAGGSRTLLETLAVPVRVGAGDLDWARSGRPEMPAPRPLRGVVSRVGGFRALPEATPLTEGDEVGPGFVVVDSPGHSPGSISLWRERDRVLVCGDAYLHLSPLTTRTKLRAPISPFSTDMAQARRSIRILADLEPELVLFGHGRPLRDAAPVLRSFAHRLGA